MKKAYSQIEFKQDIQLTPGEVYCSVVGAFENNSAYTLKSVCRGGCYEEIARVYSREIDGKPQLYILHYPGKDTNEPVTSTVKVESLERLYSGTLTEMLKTHQYKQEDIDKAQRIFVICEINYLVQFRLFLDFRYGKVNHYVKAILNSEGELQIEDSIRYRGYNEQYIQDTLTPNQPEKRKPTIYRGWQGPRDSYLPPNSWKCGHFVIRGIHRFINDIEPVPFDIDQAVIEFHTQLLQRGRDAMVMSQAEFDRQQEEIEESKGSSRLTRRSSFNLWEEIDMDGRVAEAVAVSESLPRSISSSSFNLWEEIEKDERAAALAQQAVEQPAEPEPLRISLTSS